MFAIDWKRLSMSANDCFDCNQLFPPWLKTFLQAKQLLKSHVPLKDV